MRYSTAKVRALGLRFPCGPGVGGLRQDNTSRIIFKAMKIYSCYTPSHKELFDGYFYKSLPSGLESCAHFVDVEGPGDFKSVGFLEAIKKKLCLIIESVEANPGSVIIWSDVDIVFLRDPTSSIEEIFDDDRDLDIAFQREGKIGKDEYRFHCYAMQ